MVTVLENRIPPPIVMVVTGLAMWALSWVTPTVHIPAGIRYGRGRRAARLRRQRRRPGRFLVPSGGHHDQSGQDRQRLVAGDDRHLRVHTQSHVCRTGDAACHPRGAAVERLAAARPVVFCALYHALPDHSGRARDAGQVRLRIRRLQGSRPALALRTRRMLLALKRAAIGAAVVFRVPLRAGPSHVMKLGPIGIAGNSDQFVPPCQDRIQVLVERH